MTKKSRQQTKISKLEEEVAELKNQLATSQTALATTKSELTQVKQTNQTLQTSLTNQQTTNQQFQAHYGTRKNQALAVGIIGFLIILYLAGPEPKQKPTKPTEKQAPEFLTSPTT